MKIGTKLLNDLIEEGFEIVETEGADKYWLVGKDKLSSVWPILISKVRKVTKGLINYEGENEETNEMEWFADDFRIETQAGQDGELGIIFLLFYKNRGNYTSLPKVRMFVYERHRNTESSLSDKVTWLAEQILTAFPIDIKG